MNEEISLISSPLDIDASWVEKALLSAGIEAGVQNVDIETVGTGQLGETRRFHTSYKQKKTANLQHFSSSESWYHSFLQILTSLTPESWGGGPPIKMDLVTNLQKSVHSKPPRLRFWEIKKNYPAVRKEGETLFLYNPMIIPLVPTKKKLPKERKQVLDFTLLSQYGCFW